MSVIAAQVSVYPLERTDVLPVIEDAIQTLRQHELDVQPGSMSTIAIGESERVFAALRHAFERAADEARVVMTVTVSNACPMPGSAGQR